MILEAIYQFDPAPALQRLLCRPGLDLPMEALSIAGEGWFLSLVAIALAWRTSEGRRAALKSALRGLTALALTGVIVVLTKRLIGAPRPLQLLGPEHVRVLLDPLRFNSFPSGHSAGSAALAVWALRQLSVGRWPLLFPLLVGLSRVYVGAHWATDVLAGWAVGAFVALAIWRTWPARREGTEQAPVTAAPVEASEGDR